MLEDQNNRRYLHKNRIYFPKENHCIVSILQHGRRAHTLYQIREMAANGRLVFLQQNEISKILEHFLVVLNIEIKLVAYG